MKLEELLLEAETKSEGFLSVESVLELQEWLACCTNAKDDGLRITGWEDPEGITIRGRLIPRILNSGNSLYKWKGEFRVKIKKIVGDLILYHDVARRVKSLNSFPKEVTGTIEIKSSKLKTLEGLPLCRILEIDKCPITEMKDILPYLRGDIHLLSIFALDIKSLVGVGNLTTRKIHTLEVHPLHLKEGGLGLMHINGLESLELHSYGTGFDKKPSMKALKIIEKYLGRPDDIFECQAELIENGLEKFAEM